MYILRLLTSAWVFVITGLFDSDAAYFQRQDPQVGPIKCTGMFAATNQGAARGRTLLFKIGGDRAAKWLKVRCCEGL